MIIDICVTFRAQHGSAARQATHRACEAAFRQTFRRAGGCLQLWVTKREPHPRSRSNVLRKTLTCARACSCG